MAQGFIGILIADDGAYSLDTHSLFTDLRNVGMTAVFQLDFHHDPDAATVELLEAICSPGRENGYFVRKDWSEESELIRVLELHGLGQSVDLTECIVRNSIPENQEWDFQIYEALQVVHEGLGFIRTIPAGRQKMVSHLANYLFDLPVMHYERNDDSLREFRKQIQRAKKELEDAVVWSKGTALISRKKGPSARVLFICAAICAADSARAYLSSQLIYGAIALVCATGCIVAAGLVAWKSKRSTDKCETQ
ncbi:hypothetical protein [Pseudomonas sp. LS-2]|uniref:hypothetical protein n=1 Tax=Pseudomonas sp. LS-2 TaxID=2315859 RepID=UPI000E7736AF|nr:hypothetical protein [Pseudomonas sp. LS-2]RJX72581.1 hypothetical protein D3M70_30730 [Pseudomonas sp. LS-2]